MPDAAPLLALNPALDRAALAAEFRATRRLQIRDILTPVSAQALYEVLAGRTPWGLAWQAAANGPHVIRGEALPRTTQAERAAVTDAIDAAMRGPDYAFSYMLYPLVKAALEGWAPGGVHEQLLQELNTPAVLDFMRGVSGIAELVKADGQATLYAPTQFLARHDDAEPTRGRRIAYVLNLCPVDWRPDWGGYLNFLDDDGDVIAGYRPRFNALNIFEVPQPHHVTFVPPFAPVARYAVTGWFRDK